MTPIERVLLVTERPLLIARQRQLLEYSGLDVEVSVIMPHALEVNIRPGETILVLVDAESPHSMEALAEISRKSPLSRFVLSASRVTPDLIHQALTNGMHGVLSTLIPLEEAALALGRICRGECHYRFDESVPKPTRGKDFSERERTIVSLLVKGYRNREIATALNRSESNVKMSLNRLLRKTGARSRGELAALGEIFGPPEPQLPSEPGQPLLPNEGPGFDAIWMFASQGGRS